MNSLFGFETNLHTENDDGLPEAPRTSGVRSPQQVGLLEDESDEEEYDALNDETFGAADKGDWENIHENLVRLERRAVQDDDASSDLLFKDYGMDLQLGKLHLYDTNDESADEFASKLRLDPSIWGTPFKDRPAALQQHERHAGEPANNFRISGAPKPNESRNPDPPPGLFPAMKMLSLEDLERSIIHQQRQKNAQRQHGQQMLQLQQQQKAIASKHQQTSPLVRQPPVAPLMPPSQDGNRMQLMAQMIPSPVATHSRLNAMTSPPLPATRNPFFSSVPVPGVPPLLNHPTRLPMGILPYNLLPSRPFSTPINNLAMHPAFPYVVPFGSSMQGLFNGAVPKGPPLPPRLPGTPAPFLLQPRPLTPLPNNQFNQRLVQEIQQNHPLLAFNRQLANSYNTPIMNGSQYQQRQPFGKPPQQHQQQQRRLGSGIAEECDGYANMMSPRLKQWLIGIQMTQLNSDVPYFSDYYFTVYRKERLTASNGERETGAYNVNRPNHPFTQAQEHAQFLLMSLMAKNGNDAVQRTAQARRNSESRSTCGTDEQESTNASGHSYSSSLQYENSLGKLQCSSVTAPRKLIDMDGMGSCDQANGNEVTGENTVLPRKVRNVLLLIEILYKTLLKMEDLRNHTAVDATNQLREKREQELRMMGNGNESLPMTDTANRRALFYSALLEPVRSFDDLAVSLIEQLTQDKITAILGVRKGKILLRRTLVVLHEHPYRWTLWGMILNAQPCLAKKNRDDTEGLLLALVTEFVRHVRYGQVSDLLLVAKTISSSTDVMQCIVSSKFLLSCILTIIFQMEIFCGKNPSALLRVGHDDECWWKTFLADVNRVVKDSISPLGTKPVRGTVTINPDNNIVRTVIVHFGRFSVNGTEILNFITDNGNNIVKQFARKHSLQGKSDTK